MEEFRNTLKKQLKVYVFICCIFPSVMIAAKAIFKNAGDFAHGLVLGVCVGSMLVALIFLVRNYTALHDEEKFKKLYIELTDERNVSIGKETMKTASTVCAVVTGLASIVSGFINEAVSITLAANLIVSAVITLAVQMYYKKKL